MIEAPPETGPGRSDRSAGGTLFVATALVIGLAAGGVAGALLGIRHEGDRWKERYGAAVNQATALRSEVQRFRESSRTYQEQLHSLQASVKASVGDLEHPTFTLWNSCGAGGPAAGCALTPGRQYIGGVPDTFTYFLRFRATVPVTVWIMSSANFVCWQTHLCPWTGVGWQGRTELDAVFHEAEGCAGYFVVFVSTRPGTLYPDVRVTRNPASKPTGACR